MTPERQQHRLGPGQWARAWRWRRCSPQPGVPWLGWVFLETAVRPRSADHGRCMCNLVPQTWSLVAQVLTKSARRRAGKKCPSTFTLPAHPMSGNGHTQGCGSGGSRWGCWQCPCLQPICTSRPRSFPLLFTHGSRQANFSPTRDCASSTKTLWVWSEVRT